MNSPVSPDDSTPPRTGEGRPQPDEGRSAPGKHTAPGYALALLCALYAVSYVDRSILSVLVEPITADLGLSDTQIGIVIGLGFAIVYALVGVPVAHMLDRGNRCRILGAGVLLWSGMTMASSASTGFVSLTLCRIGVAVGEAVLTPAAISLIADFYGRERAAAPTALYSSVATLMGLGALAVGAGALHLSAHLQPFTGLPAWRMTLLLVGSPGLLIGTLFLLSVREPARIGDPVASDGGSFAEFMAYLRARRSFYLPFFCGIAGLATYFMGMSTWLPATFSRSFGMSPAQAGYLIGMASIVPSIAAAIFWPWVAVRMARRRPTDGILACYVAAIATGCPFMILAPLAPSIGLMLGGFAIGLFCTVVIGALPGLTIQHHGADRYRARLMALVLLAGGLVGYCAGSVLVPLLGALAGDPQRALNHGLALLALLTAPLILLCFEISRRHAVVDR